MDSTLCRTACIASEKNQLVVCARLEPACAKPCGHGVGLLRSAKARARGRRRRVRRALHLLAWRLGKSPERCRAVARRRNLARNIVRFRQMIQPGSRRQQRHGLGAMASGHGFGLDHPAAGRPCLFKRCNLAFEVASRAFKIMHPDHVADRLNPGQDQPGITFRTTRTVWHHGPCDRRGAFAEALIMRRCWAGVGRVDDSTAELRGICSI
ncbi:MAG: hypothetical protein JWQ94_2920 [Tardiphaga sp.]|nr:hypothetical protein [Tardiphaga sp.]